MLSGEWTATRFALRSSLVGMRNERKLRENVAAADWWLTGADRVEIGAICAETGVTAYADTPQAV